MDAVTCLLSDLVAIPSVNPMGRPLTGPGVLEAGMTDYLERWFRELGAPYERTTIVPGRDNIVARYESPRGRRTVLFDAHQDTVPTDGMTIPPFVPERIAGRLYGRGSCDVKGGMAAMLIAFARLVRQRPPRSASVLMACTADEEFTHLGSSHLAAHGPGADLAIVAEPTRLDLVNCHKGAVRWKVRARGVACHSATPHLGINAIYRMAAVVEALAAHADELAKLPPHPVLGPPSLSVGRIEGGQSVNVVPDRCEIEVDRRIVPGEASTQCLTRARDLLIERLGPESADWFEFLPPWVTMPALAPSAAGSDAWVGVVRRAVAEAIGRTPEVTGVPYGTDAGPLGAAGLPCLVFGPGDIAQAHTKDEWIELDQLGAAVDAYF
ncbi:MAG TPA: M20 family metallopeptidase, partial [Isosphaeraceae bacterium]|nr:M20 family metallopeptidase [Isosphaeraceae bacterium]